VILTFLAGRIYLLRGCHCCRDGAARVVVIALVVVAVMVAGGPDYVLVFACRVVHMWMLIVVVITTPAVTVGINGCFREAGDSQQDYTCQQGES